MTCSSCARVWRHKNSNFGNGFDEFLAISSDLLDPTWINTQMLHGAGIFPYIYPKHGTNVGKYSSTMEHLGYGSLYTKCPLLFKLFGGSVTCSRFETGFRTPNPWWGVDGGTETYRIDLLSWNSLQAEQQSIFQTWPGPGYPANLSERCRWSGSLCLCAGTSGCPQGPAAPVAPEKPPPLMVMALKNMSMRWPYPCHVVPGTEYIVNTLWIHCEYIVLNLYRYVLHCTSDSRDVSWYCFRKPQKKTFTKSVTKILFEQKAPAQ